MVTQNEITAMAFAMSSAVIDAGDADLVLSLGEIPRLLDRVVGEGKPLSTTAARASESVFGAGGEMGRLMSATDWGSTALGPVDRWPTTLRSTLGMALSNPVAMNLMWGPDLLQLYNDAYLDLIGDRHPAALGRPARETWADTADRFRLVRVAGVLATLMDTTEQVRGARRQVRQRRSSSPTSAHTPRSTPTTAGFSNSSPNRSAPPWPPPGRTAKLSRGWPR